MHYQSYQDFYEDVRMPNKIAPIGLSGILLLIMAIAIITVVTLIKEIK